MSQENIGKNSSNKKVMALAIICVILAASLIGVIAVYQPNNNLQEQIAEKDNTINSLTEQIATLQLQLSQTTNTSTYAMQIAYLNSQLSGLNDTLTNAYMELTELQKVVQLGASGILYGDTFNQDANGTTTLWNDQLEYAGYVVVEAQALANTTYAQAIYSFSEVNFNLNQTLGTSGKALFPVLPGTVEIRIGNVNQTDTNSVNATATYYY